jgi:hypothetical protein
MDTSKAEHAKGRPLMCQACKGVLLLNAQSLRLHLASKRHRRVLKRFPKESVGQVCFAAKAREASPGAGPLAQAAQGTHIACAFITVQILQQKS